MKSFQLLELISITAQEWYTIIDLKKMWYHLAHIKWYRSLNACQYKLPESFFHCYFMKFSYFYIPQYWIYMVFVFCLWTMAKLALTNNANNISIVYFTPAQSLFTILTTGMAISMLPTTSLRNIKLMPMPRVHLTWHLFIWLASECVVVSLKYRQVTYYDEKVADSYSYNILQWNIIVVVMSMGFHGWLITLDPTACTCPSTGLIVIHSYGKV